MRSGARAVSRRRWCSAAGFLRHGASAAQCADIVPKIVDGSLTLAFAQTERHWRDHLADISTTAKRAGAGWVLDGERVWCWTATPPTR